MLRAHAILRRSAPAFAAFAIASLVAATGLASAAPGSSRAPAVKVAFLQGEQLVYVDRPGTGVKAAVTALLAGPTKAERAREVTTQVPAGTRLRGLSKRGNVATIDLDVKFATGVKAESLSARVAQLVLTATRLPNVRYVRLLVNGGTPLGLFPGFVTRYPLTAKGIQSPSEPPPTAPAPQPPAPPSDDTRAVQQRLAELAFLPAEAVDGRSGPRTTSAVVAFQKWAGLARDGVVGAATRSTLFSAAQPTPIRPGSGRRVEVLLDRQLALVVDGARLLRILDISTGKPGFDTPAGSFRVTRKEQRSWSVPYKVWLPWASYFVGGVAFHEYSQVPPTPASHGCVRVQRWDAQWLYNQLSIGTPVTVLPRSR